VARRETTPLEFSSLEFIDNDFVAYYVDGSRTDFTRLGSAVIRLLSQHKRYNNMTLVDHMSQVAVGFKRKVEDPVPFKRDKLKWLIDDVIKPTLQPDQYLKCEFIGCGIAELIRRVVFVGGKDQSPKDKKEMIELGEQIGLVTYMQGRASIRQLLGVESAGGSSLGCGRSRLPSRILRDDRSISVEQLVARIPGARLFASRAFSEIPAINFYGICQRVRDLHEDETLPFSLCAATYSSTYASMVVPDGAELRKPIRLGEFYARVFAKVNEMEGFDPTKCEDFTRNRVLSFADEMMIRTSNALVKVGAGDVDLLQALSGLVHTNGDEATAAAVLSIGGIFRVGLE
jgi:hypothetical protein